MSDLFELLSRQGPVDQELARLSGLNVYPLSVTDAGDTVFFLVKRDGRRVLGTLSERVPSDVEVDTRAASLGGLECHLGVGEASPANARALRSRLPYLAPVRVGTTKSAGLGDRLGIATPGHIRAMRQVPGMVPVFAQQSIREMERTDRTPQQVIDDAMWGVFQEGWREGYGADADHLKVEADIDVCVAAGYVMFTLDPRDHVDNDAETDDVATLRAKFEDLPWNELETSAADTRRRYLDRTWDVGELRLGLTAEDLLRGACKYGRALSYVLRMYRHLLAAVGDAPYELEVSVDETETPTRPVEHLFVANELKRLGVEWESLAPRYIGRFEKGVDYIGDLDRFEAEVAQHAAISRALGPYKLSLHSGSDKFSIYPLVARYAGDLVHLKTAGTSYLEALRAVARVDADLFREILSFAITHYEVDKASYHVSGELQRMRPPDSLADEKLADVLDQFDTRQALHVTFGSVVTARDGSGGYLFRKRLLDVLDSHEDEHYQVLQAHIARHLQPFCA